MRNHPLTPMTDANLVRVLGRQTKAEVGLVPYAIVQQGSAQTRYAFEKLRQRGISYAVIDAIEDEHLRRLGPACADIVLATGGAGAAPGLPHNFRPARLVAEPGRE